MVEFFCVEDLIFGLGFGGGGLCRILIFLVMGQSCAMCNNGSGIFSVIMAEFISPLSM